MKMWVFGAITLVCGVSASAALACPVGQDTRPPRPVVQNVSLQASEMLQRASRLETVAVGHDESARSFDRQAETLSARARVLRNQAFQVASFSDREGILDVADELAARADADRARADSERAQASQLRMQARALRDRAAQLVQVGGGGGWRNKRVRDFARPPVTRGDTAI